MKYKMASQRQPKSKSTKTFPVVQKVEGYLLDANDMLLICLTRTKTQGGYEFAFFFRRLNNISEYHRERCENYLFDFSSEDH